MNPEAFAAIAVEDLVMKTGKDAIHADGAPSKEYLGMLALYALRRNALMFSDEVRSIRQAFKLASGTFDPFNMSENLICCLTDILKAE